MWGEDEKLEDMIHDVEDHFTDCPHLIKSLKDDAEKPLYVGCSKFTKLSTVFRLYGLKPENEWSDKSFTALLNLLKDMLSETNELSDHTYDVEKILCFMSMNYGRRHACPNDCILYRNNYDSLERCPVCEVDRYKKYKNKISAKILW